MLEEVNVGANWWTSQLRKKMPSNPALLEDFQKALSREMLTRYQSHWYESDSSRGSGYRSISYDQRLDPLLVRAAQGCGISIASLETLLSHARYRVMFVNPREVKIINTALLTEEARYIYKRDEKGNTTESSRSDSPVASPSSPEAFPLASPSSTPASAVHIPPSISVPPTSAIPAAQIQGDPLLATIMTEINA